MAAFDGIPLQSPRGKGGAILFLRARPKHSGIAQLGGGVEVEIREDVLAAVVRGVPGSDFDTVMGLAPELLNRGLDVFALTGLQASSLDGTSDDQVCWWEGEQGRVVRMWTRLDAVFSFSASVVVRRPDGSIKTDPNPHEIPWQESMRYYRMSQATDDLFDAFRNVYLALESILSVIAPIKVSPQGRAVESEKVWFKRALATVAVDIDLDTYTPGGSGNPIHDIYDELHNRVRNRIFHAKDGLQPFLPQSLESRSQVAEAKERYSELYLAVAGNLFVPNQNLTGSLRVAETVLDRMRKDTLDRGPYIGFTSDASPFEASDTELSPRGDACVVVPAQAISDPRASEGYAAVMGQFVVADYLFSLPAIGRFGLLGSQEEAMAICDFEGGQLSLEGFDRCEAVLSVRAIGGKRRKFVYAT